MKYAPSAWGAAYHALDVDEALGGGSAGGGKTRVLIADPLGQALVEHRRCERMEVRWGESRGWALHIRKEFPRLEQTIQYSKFLYPSFDPGAKYDEQKHLWRFSTGYRVQFGHLKDRDSFLNYRSFELTHFGVDEAGEIEERDQYEEMVSRVRTTDPVLQRLKRSRLMSNPTPNWLRDLFVDPAPRGREVLVRKVKLGDGSTVEKTRIFLPARLADNPDPAFRREYEATLRDRPAHIRAALLDGDWYIVAGAFFAEEWDPDRVVVKPFRIPPGWRKFRSGDWGYKEECVILWWAVSPEGDLICYRELTLNGRKAKKRFDARQVAERIKEIEQANGEWNSTRNCSRLQGWMDTQLWEERGHTGRTMADEMAVVGIYWRKATKGRRQAAQQMFRRLKEHGVSGQPGIMFFETCPLCISTIPALGTDADDPEKPADGGKDHWWAATAYALAANPLPTGREHMNTPDPDDDEEVERRPYLGAFGYGGH